jgi:hypothetical protein
MRGPQPAASLHLSAEQAELVGDLHALQTHANF